MRYLILAFLVSFFSFQSIAQIRIGEWREHLPYRKANQVIASDNRIYCRTESGLFSYSLTDNEIQAFSKAKGLSDSEITSIAWSEDQDILVIGYTNGNLDLITDSEILNIPDIKHADILLDKSINNILMHGEFVYLATGFGIVLINLNKQEIADTYYIGDGGEKLKVNELLSTNTDIWAATVKGIFRASLDGSNLADFSNWEHLSNLPDYQKECDHLAVVGTDLFLSRKLTATTSEILRYNGNIWTNFGGAFSTVYALKNLEDKLWICQSDLIQIFSENGVESFEISLGDQRNYRDVVKVQNRTFIADHENSLLEITGGNVIQIKPEGPLQQIITGIFSVEDETWTVAGSPNESFNGSQSDAALFLFKDQKWTNFSAANTPELIGSHDLFQITGNLRDNSRIYAASWGDGVFEFNDEGLQASWNTTNSPLESKGIASMASDKDGNLWMLDVQSTFPVKVHLWNDDWLSLNYSALNNRNDLKKIIVLSNGDKWVLRAEGEALFAFNENSTLSNSSDDVTASFFLRDENNATISSDIYDMCEDEEANVWLATSNGVAIYNDPGAIFRTGSFFAYRPIITVNGSTQYLLSTEKVRSIAVDGANQKWLGTENSGVFLVSENGEKQIAHFNTDNSPLPSNLVEKISVNSNSGEVFFLTDKGMISYRASVNKASENFDNLYVFPNPVRPEYRGDITVSGLMQNSMVKITDLTANLVWEGKSLGGQIIWDGKNFNGNRVHTGVYLIFCSSSDGSKSKVIKLLFIN
ncbi:hypothetical protein [Ancylomarina longa]|uniref:PorZ N-terminal beta-propeller domain-containing protein n=1 Tax=Ancylomarina longa TaxID=2487017 RepID=A0A434AWA5_9BACT|nr:hypothetical protein [Ancylomarina longa]RUT78764.1 hypothetical protein DLK05_06395 [Ancylomarina longa]